MKKLIGVFVLGMAIGLSLYSWSLITVEEDKSSAILNALTSNCECEEIKQFLYVKGVGISPEEISTETAEYSLKNCSYTNLDSEVLRIHSILLKEVHGYTDIDQLSLEFVKNNKHTLITIRNGIIN